MGWGRLTLGSLVLAGAAGAGIGLAALTVGAPAPVAAEPRAEVVRTAEGYGYVPHDPAGFVVLAAEVAALPEADLAQMAGFAEALAAALDRESPEALAGRIGDLLTAVDLAYGAAEAARPEGFDPEALRDIADRIGYDTRGLTDL